MRGQNPLVARKKKAKKGPASSQDYGLALQSRIYVKQGFPSEDLRQAPRTRV